MKSKINILKTTIFSGKTIVSISFIYKPKYNNIFFVHKFFQELDGFNLTRTPATNSSGRVTNQKLFVTKQIRFGVISRTK